MKRYRENIWGKAPEERPCAQSIWKNNLNRSAGLNGNCTTPSSCELSAISVLGCTIRLMNCRAEAKSDWNSVATLNVHDNWLRMLQDDEPPKSSWRPRKSTKSWVQFRHAKDHESHTITEKKKGPSRGKIGPTEPRGVEGMYQKFAMRQQRKDKSPKYKEAQRICFSTPYWEKCWAASRAHCTI